MHHYRVIRLFFISTDKGNKKNHSRGLVVRAEIAVFEVFMAVTKENAVFGTSHPRRRHSSRINLPAADKVYPPRCTILKLKLKSRYV
jgi:hypothetical protein